MIRSMHSPERPPPPDEASSHREPPASAGDPLERAYTERTQQLHDARGAVAEAVSTLRVELNRHREEAAALRAERDQAVADNQAVRHEVEAQRNRVGVLEDELRDSRELIAVLQNMKVMRWSAPVRRIVYRLRARRG